MSYTATYESGEVGEMMLHGIPYFVAFVINNLGIVLFLFILIVVLGFISYESK